MVQSKAHAGATATHTAPAQTEGEKLSSQLARRGIDEVTWRALRDSVFPGARDTSVLMAIDYCKARKLDPLLKPVHIVPMDVKVRDEQGERTIRRDVVMPGIYLYRTVAHRTGLYMGHSEPVLEGEEKHNAEALITPQRCKMTFFRWNPVAQRQIDFPVTVYFSEVAAFKNDGYLNQKWTESPVQMLTKCAEAAGLREAFPEEIGGTHTDDELGGKTDQGQTFDAESTQNGKPHTAEPTLVAAGSAAGAAHTHVPLAEIRRLIDETGISENELLRNFELPSLEAMQLKDVQPVMTFLQTLRVEPPR